MANEAINILRQAQSMQMNQEDLLRSIDLSLKEILHDGVDVSQSSMADLRNDTKRYGRSAKEEAADRWAPNRDRQSNKSKSASKIVDEFTDELERQFMQSLIGDPISKTIRKSMQGLADELNVSIDDLGKEVGRQLGEKAADAFKGNPIGKRLADEVSSIKDFGLNKATDAFKKLGSTLKPNTTKDVSNVVNVFSKMGESGGAVEAASSAMSSMGAAAGEVAPAVASMGGEVATAAAAFPALTLAIGAGVIAVTLLSKAFGPAVDGLKDYAKSVHAAANASRELEKFHLQKTLDRISADVNSMIEASYKVMQDAADEMINSWNQSLQTISATQGYTKADVQDLLTNYTKRLQSEGLTSVVSSADIMKSLESVLKSGLSGQVAEEFAYLATKLNAAVPTEDFFQYASTYASIAANQIAAGMDQAKAIEYANSQLEAFASNLLYSSRELAGGFSTGLTNASNLFEQANKIATTSRTGEVSNISGVLTSVSAIVGAIAPDLASGLVDSIVSAATGGNSEAITALRSLSGTGASNTAFIKQLAENPQSVFSELFKNLGGLQTMSNDNFMEVAEGLSQVFGVSMDAFARVDFNRLASAIDSMNIQNDALTQNMALLVSGQSTANAEQTRIQQINEYMLDQGLTYILDNEVARQIQQHIWDQEMAEQMQEAEYAVNLQGSALTFLEGLSQTVENIFKFLHPVSTVLNKIHSIQVANKQADNMKKDIASLIEAGKVGSGNSKAYQMLTSTSVSGSSAKSYLEMLGGQASYRSGALATADSIGNISKMLSTTNGSTFRKLANTAIISSRQNSGEKVSSQYTWGNIGKSFSNAISGGYNQGSAYAALTNTAQSTINNSVGARLQKFLNTMEDSAKGGQSYSDWLATASNFGIKDVKSALSDYGISEDTAKSTFNDFVGQAAAQYSSEINELKSEWYRSGIEWTKEIWPKWDEALIARREHEDEEWSNYTKKTYEFRDLLIDRCDEQIKQMIASNKQLKEFYDQWVDYYVEHTAYTRDTLGAYDIQQIRNAEKDEQGDAVLALANALTSNNMNLKDPVVQSNVLLSKILLGVEALIELSNDTTTVSLPVALAGLGLGITSEQ